MNKIREILFSATARDTLILFVGNGFSAFWGFLFIWLVSSALTKPDFGVFSATLNLVIILTSLADIGISSGSVNFIAAHSAKGEEEKVKKYIMASFVIRFTIVVLISAVVLTMPKYIAVHLLATNDSSMGVWAALIPIFLFPTMFFPFILQAKGKFLQSTVYDNLFYVARLVFASVYFLVGALTIKEAYWAFAAGFLVNIIMTLVYVKTDFIFSKPTKIEYTNLLKFSGWIGVNRIVSSISGKLDVQMLAAMAGALTTAVYSIPSRLASFIIVLAGSYSAVLAPRMAGFNDKEKEKRYIIKSTLALLPICFGIFLWIIFAHPFIYLLWKDKYIESVPIFQALAASQIPFLFTVPPVTAIIYAMKKTVYIGTLSFVQIAAIFLLNFYFIPRFGAFGPTLTFGITNTLLAIYVWIIVIKHYWFSGEVALNPKLK